MAAHPRSAQYRRARKNNFLSIMPNVDLQNSRDLFLGCMIVRGVQRMIEFSRNVQSAVRRAAARFKQSPQRNAGIGPAISDKASPSLRALSSVKTGATGRGQPAGRWWSQSYCRPLRDHCSNQRVDPLAWFPRLYPALFAALLAVTPALAEVQLARVFSDHMVLQAQRPVPVWGTAAPGERISVAIAAQTKTTVAGTDGRWRVTLDPLDYTSGHTPQNIVVRATNEIRVTDVLIGEVWLSSGQSNMRYALGRLADATGRPNDPAPFAAEIARSANPLIRLLNVSGGTPADQRWAVSGPTTTPAFSAITYFFARDLVRDRGVPVGVVDLGKGGAPLRAFLPPADLAALGSVLPPPSASGKPDTVAGSIYEKDFRLFAPFAIRGLLWYQGEADAGRAAQYPRMLGAMISRWRSDLDSPTLPVLIVQLPPYERRRKDPPKLQVGVKWAEMREAQWRVTQTIPQTHLAVIADLGERLDIHPRRKPEVASRLALLARARVYGEQIPHSGPLLRSSRVEGGKIILTFDHADGGLVLSQEKLVPLTVAGDDGRFVPASAEIDGLDRLVITRPPESTDAKYVRYAWHDYFTPGLFNAYGLPASPFRTDDFPLTTAPAQR